MLPLTANSSPMQVVTSRRTCLGKALCDDSGQTLLPMVPCQPCSCSHGPGSLSMVSTPQCPTPLLGYLIPSECSNMVCHLYFFIIFFLYCPRGIYSKMPSAKASNLEESFLLCLSQYQSNAVVAGWKISPGNSLLCLSLTSLD